MKNIIKDNLVMVLYQMDNQTKILFCFGNFSIILVIHLLNLYLNLYFKSIF